MIADLLPLLAFAAVLVIARNAFEAYVLDHARTRLETEQRRHAHSGLIPPRPGADAP